MRGIDKISRRNGGNKGKTGACKDILQTSKIRIEEKRLREGKGINLRGGKGAKGGKGRKSGNLD